MPYAKAVELEYLLNHSDVVSLHCPQTAQTAQIINAATIAQMKDGSFLINTSRGGLIEEYALADALKSGKLAGAALDVAVPEPLPQNHFLWDAPNLLLTPHVSGNMSLAKTCQLVIDIFLRNLEHWTKGEPLEHLVDIGQGY